MITKVVHPQRFHFFPRFDSEIGSILGLSLLSLLSPSSSFATRVLRIPIAVVEAEQRKVTSRPTSLNQSYQGANRVQFSNTKGLVLLPSHCRCRRAIVGYKRNGRETVGIVSFAFYEDLFSCLFLHPLLCGVLGARERL